jgi:RNA ligase (TIGR02306 family)
VLGIVKWEAPIPAELVGQVKGFFPSFIRKTDQERCQNFEKEIFEDNKGAHYEVTMKLDGTSVTYYFYNGEVGVCSRNLELKINEANAGNSLVRMLLDSGLYDALMKLGHPVAIQGELMGPGIQGNREQFKEHKFFVFDVQALDAGIYLTPDERTMLVSNLIFNYGVKPQMVQHVPIVAHTPELYDSLGISSVAGLLHFAEGPSINHPVREGLVFKRVDGKFSFKAISNKFLEKEKD